MVTVCCAGHVNWDVTLRVDRLPESDGEARIHDQHSSGGGSAANVAAALARLDVDSGVVGAVGDDENGLLARRALDGSNVDVTHLASMADQPTTVKYLLVAESGEVSVLGNEGANETIGPEDVDPAYVRATSHVHLTSQRPETAARIADIASEADVPVSFDPGRRLPDRDFSAALERSDVVFVNDLEAESLLAKAHDSLVSDRVVVVKHGERGAEVHAPDGRYSHPGFEVDPVDTTGAGDAFAAGFIAVRLADGGYERALEFANACGALAARGEGARTAPSREEIRVFLDSQFPG